MPFDATHYDFITKDPNATEADCANRCELAQFHYFNPSGAVAEFDAMCKDVDDAVSAGRCKSGAIFAYGSLNDHARDALRKIVLRHRSASVWQVKYAVEAVRRATKSGRDFLAGLQD